MDCSKYECKRIILCVISFVAALLSTGLASHLWLQIWSKAMSSGDVLFAMNVFIVGQAIIQLLAGMAFGIAVTPVIIFIIAPLLGMEIALEKKIRLTNVVIIDAKPENSIFSVFLYSYIVFGIAVIIARIIAIRGQNMMESYFTAAEFVIKVLIPFILLFLVTPYILRDRSSIRSLKKNLTVTYPSRLQQFMLTIVVGMGSVAALAPIYTELVILIGDELTALVYFIYVILMILIPSITVVIGLLIGTTAIAKPFFQKAVENLEKVVRKYGKAKTISLTKSEL